MCKVPQSACVLPTQEHLRLFRLVLCNRARFLAKHAVFSFRLFFFRGLLVTNPLISSL